MTIGDRIRQIRTEQNISQTELAQAAGISKQTLYKYENNIIVNIPSTCIERLAQALGVSPAVLMGWDDDNLSRYGILPIDVQRIPLLGEIACGEPIYASEDREIYVLAGTEIKADFALRAKGDSMIGARIMDGDIVFIRRQDMVDNGEIAAVIIGDEATLKRVFYYPQDHRLILHSENPKYKPFEYSGAELDRIKILGKAIAFQSDVY